MATAQRKKTTAKNSSRKKPAQRKPARQTNRRTTPQIENSLHLEICILMLFAISVLLMLSNFGIGGKVGDLVSRFFFGAFGWMAYIFPLFLFLGTAFTLVNRKNPFLGIKLGGMILGFFCLSGLIHMLTVGYDKGNTLSGYYQYCSSHHTGGGFFGGGIAMALDIAFGDAGTYVILCIAFLIAVILVTQRPVLAPLKKKGELVYQETRENHRRRREERQIAFEELTIPKEAAAEKKIEQKSEQKKEQKKEEKSGTRKLFAKESKAEEKIPEKESAEVPALGEIRIERPQPMEIFPENDDLLSEELPLETPADDFPGEPVLPAAEKKQRKTKSSPEEIQAGIESIEKEMQEEIPPRKYEFPSLDLLKRGSRKTGGDSDSHLMETAAKLQNTLYNFGVHAKVTNVSCGPTVTRYELQPEQGVKVSKIVSLTDDIKLNLAAADIRIEAPIPGKAAVGIEVPNATNQPVMLRDLLESKEFREFPSELAFAVGKDIGGKPVVADIGKMPHLLIAGATGSGKSVCINTLIMSLIYKASPEDVKLIMVDPKVVELSVYNGIPHLFIPVVTDPKKAAGALNWAVAEMTERYNKFAECNVRDLKGYNEKVEQLKDIPDENKPKKLPKIVIIVDELADLMMVAKGEVEDAIVRLSQLARAAGIHLIIATQRPSVDVITGLIKANMPSRIAFAVSSGVDSRTVLDENGAEKLLGKGDMLYSPQDYKKPARLQGAFVSDDEVADVVNFLTQDHKTDASYDQKITEMVNAAPSAAGGIGGGEDVDAYFTDAGKFIIAKDKASIGMLQRAFKIGFNRAARIMDQLADAGVVGPEEGTKPRKVLMSAEEFENYIEESL